MVTVVPSSNLPPRTHKAGWRLSRVIKCVLGGNTVEGFNRRFNELVKSLPQDVKPPEKAILIFYIQAFEGEMRYQLKDKEPTNVREAQDKAIKIDKNMQDSGKSNVLGFSEGSPLESDKVKKVEN